MYNHVNNWDSVYCAHTPKPKFDIVPNVRTWKTITGSEVWLFGQQTTPQSLQKMDT